jgi:hypothetical protein
MYIYKLMLTRPPESMYSLSSVRHNSLCTTSGPISDQGERNSCSNTEDDDRQLFQVLP